MNSTDPIWRYFKLSFDDKDFFRALPIVIPAGVESMMSRAVITCVPGPNDNEYLLLVRTYPLRVVV